MNDVSTAAKRRSRARVALGWISMATAAGVAGWLGWWHWSGVEKPVGWDALEEAWTLVRNNPTSEHAWGALGDAQTSVDRFVEAEHSYRTALRLGPENASLHARLGFLLYGQGDDDGALEHLAAAEQGGVRPPMLRWTLAKLIAKAEDGTPHTEAQSDDEQVPPTESMLDTQSLPCTLAVERLGRRGTFVVPVVAGEQRLRLIVDTGASITVLERETVDGMGLEVDEERVMRAMTATGIANFATAKLDSIEVAGRVVRDLRIAVCGECAARGVAGLLGLDTQAALGMVLEPNLGVVRFGDCHSPASGE